MIIYFLCAVGTFVLMIVTWAVVETIAYVVVTSNERAKKLDGSPQ